MNQQIDILLVLVQIHEHYKFYFGIPNQHILEPKNQYPIIFCMSLLLVNEKGLQEDKVLQNMLQK